MNAPPFLVPSPFGRARARHVLPYLFAAPFAVMAFIATFQATPRANHVLVVDAFCGAAILFGSRAALGNPARNAPLRSSAFLAVACAPTSDVATLIDVIGTFHAIDNRVPTSSDLRSALAWLIATGAVERRDSGCMLAPPGRELFRLARMSDRLADQKARLASLFADTHVSLPVHAFSLGEIGSALDDYRNRMRRKPAFGAWPLVRRAFRNDDALT